MKHDISLPFSKAEWGVGMASGALMSLAWDIGFVEPLSINWWLTAAGMAASAGTVEYNLKRFRLEGRIRELELEQAYRIAEYHAALDEWWAEKERRERDG